MQAFRDFINRLFSSLVFGGLCGMAIMTCIIFAAVGVWEGVLLTLVGYVCAVVVVLAFDAIVYLLETTSRGGSDAEKAHETRPTE